MKSGELQQQMKEFTLKLHAIIGDHNKVIIGSNEQFDKTDLGDSCLFESPGEEDITYPWDDEWHDVAMYDETTATQ